MFINKVCDALQNAQIPYAIVGGYAVALHGVPQDLEDVKSRVHMKNKPIQYFNKEYVARCRDLTLRIKSLNS